MYSLFTIENGGRSDYDDLYHPHRKDGRLLYARRPTAGPIRRSKSTTYLAFDVFAGPDKVDTRARTRPWANRHPANIQRDGRL